MKAAIVAAAVLAGLAVSAAPAMAAQCKTGGGALYVCEYGVTNHALPAGQKEQFLVGMDQAVWTRWTIGGTWTGWQSLSGIAKSNVVVQDFETGTAVLVKGADGRTWAKFRDTTGQWQPWDKISGIPAR
ncbi:hypothetical protein [Kitasatospora gansuensis]